MDPQSPFPEDPEDPDAVPFLDAAKARTAELTVAADAAFEERAAHPWVNPSIDPRQIGVVRGELREDSYAAVAKDATRPGALRAGGHDR